MGEGRARFLQAVSTSEPRFGDLVRGVSSEVGGGVIFCATFLVHDFCHVKLNPKEIATILSVRSGATYE
jgi:hypothetical protein